MSKSVYDIEVKTIDGKTESLSIFKNKVILIVNTASNCGYTPQYAELEEIYKKFKNEGFLVLGFPCNQFGAQEPGDEKTIKQFCETNYHISFPIFSKIEVNGENTHPLFALLKLELPGILGTEKIKWNFTKFLLDKSGIPFKRYAPQESPRSLEKDIKFLLNK